MYQLLFISKKIICDHFVKDNGCQEKCSFMNLLENHMKSLHDSNNVLMVIHNKHIVYFSFLQIVFNVFKFKFKGLTLVFTILRRSCIWIIESPCGIYLVTSISQFMNHLQWNNVEICSRKFNDWLRELTLYLWFDELITLEIDSIIHLVWIKIGFFVN